MIQTSTTIEQFPILDLVEFEDNPRTITPEARERLRRSLDRFGLYRPLVVWRNAAGIPVVVAGNQRLSILREMLDDDATVPCVVLELDERAARLVSIRDNNEDGEWEWEALGAYLTSLAVLSSEPLDWSLTGLDEDTVASLLVLSEERVDRVAAPSSAPVVGAGSVARETLSSSPLVEEEEEEEPGPEYPERRFTRVSIGSLRGQVSHETYARFLRTWSAYSERLGSTEVSVVVAAMARVLLRTRATR